MILEDTSLSIAMGQEAVQERDRAISEAIAIITATTETQDKRHPTIIYRLGSGTYTNLTPRPQDTTGLSYSLTPPPLGTSFTVTTIEAINATGVLRAIKDGPNHVSVVPVNISEMPSWIDPRPTAESSPHPYTQILRNISVRLR